jgi:hypothetical protein
MGGKLVVVLVFSMADKMVQLLVARLVDQTEIGLAVRSVDLRVEQMVKSSVDVMDSCSAVLRVFVKAVPLVAQMVV